MSTFFLLNFYTVIRIDGWASNSEKNVCFRAKLYQTEPEVAHLWLRYL